MEQVEISATAPGSPGQQVPKRISVLIAEDHSLVRAGMHVLLDAEPSILVIAETSSGTEALECAGKLLPDVLLLDIRLPGMDGLAVTRELHITHPSVRVLVVSAFNDPDYVNEALRVGAAGYLLKTVGPRELIQAIHSVASGSVVLDGEISTQLALRLSGGSSRTDGLSARESEVLALLARGLSNKQIASKLHLGLRTVEGHVTQILAKLSVTSRTEAAVWATTHNLVHNED